ncbi:MAG: hypothetical protein OXF78_06765 [Rhodospirillales bacterium]|nr:hypothetical protein [Rhodospirillales bacterium]
MTIGVEASRRERAGGFSEFVPRSRANVLLAVPDRAVEGRGPQVSRLGLKPHL